MTTRKNFRTYTIALTAGVESHHEIDGDMYAIIDSTDEFTLTLDESNRLQKQEKGMGGKFAVPYNRVVLVSSTTQTITIVLGFGEFSDARSTLSATVNASLSPTNTLDNPADIVVGVAATLLRAADVNTKEVVIHVPSTASNSIRVGGASVAANTGIEVEPGSTLVLACEAALYGIRDGGSDVTVSTLKLTRP